MKTALFTATIVLMMVAATLGGRITPWADPDVFYPNTGKISYMDLYFQLDNKLPAGHVMRVTLPFASSPTLNTTSTDWLPTIYSASSTSRGGFLSSSTQTAIGNTTFVKQSSSAPFHNYLVFNIELEMGTNYILRLNFTTSPSDTAGFLGFIQMETMSPSLTVSTASGSGDTAITYDLNNAFAPLQLYAAPGTISSSGFTIVSDANSTISGASSVRQISIIPTQNFFNWPTIQLSWDNLLFSVSNLTSIDTGVSTTTVTPLTYGTGTNQFTSTSGSSSTAAWYNIYHNAPLFTTQTVKYNITTANPASTSSQTINFSVKIFHRYNYNLTDVSSVFPITVAASGASSTTVTKTINAYQILLSWGVDPLATSLTSNSNPLAKVFTFYASTATNQIYQAVRWVFGTTGTWATSLYQTTVTICTSGDKCDILENSLVSNMTGYSCAYVFPSTSTGTKYITCNSTQIASTGNMIGGRIWLVSTLVGSASTYPSTNSDSAFGTISISQYSTTTSAFGSSLASTTLSAINNGYGTMTNNNAAPLANLNGNGPLAGFPASGSAPNTTRYADYATLWTGTGGPATSAGTAFAAHAGPVSAPTMAQRIGGIYGSTGTNTKYHLSLITTATITPDASTNTWGVTAATSSSDFIFTGYPGVDIFMNPYIFSQASTPSTGTAAAISNCWAGNAFKRQTLSGAVTASYTSNTTDSATTMSLNCFTNSVTNSLASYIRLRQLFTSSFDSTPAIYAKTISSDTTSTADAPTIDSDITSPSFLSFNWESAVTIASAYSGASLRADNYIGDYYGLFYSLSPITGSGATTALPVKSGSTSSTKDIGEVTSSMYSTNLTFNFGTPFFWSQMIVGPYGSSATGEQTPDYYGKKAVWIGGYTAFSGSAANYTSNTVVQMIRIRGSLATSGTDSGLYPSSTGKIALFIGTLYASTANAAIEPLGGMNTAKADGTAGYNTQTSGNSLIGSANVRCWNSGSIGACMQERAPRVPLAANFAKANSAGITALLDHYQVITSNASYSGSFSISILIKPLVTTNTLLQQYFYRFGFVYNNQYYIQSWDQFFDNGAITNSSGYMTTIGNTFGTTGATTVQYPDSTGQSACVLPYSTSANGVTPGVRVAPNNGDLDNAVAAASVTMSIQYAANGVNTPITLAKFQGHATWCVQWNFAQNSSFAISSSGLENSNAGDKCATFDYLTADGTQTFYCVYCPMAVASTSIPIYSSSSPATATMTNFFGGPAINIPTTSIITSTLTDDTGKLVENGNCLGMTSTNNIWTAQTATITTAPFSSYAISGQKLTIGFNAPSGLATTLVDKIQIAGKVSGSSTTDSSFPYGSFDGAAVCKLVPTNQISNATAYVDCSVNVNSNAIVVSITDTISGTQASVTPWTLFIWGFTGATAAVNTTAYYVLQTYKGTYLVDQTTTTNTNYAQWALSNGTSTLGTNNIAYQRNIVYARGYFKFDIVFSTRTWFYNDKVILNLDAVASSSVNANASVVKCRITDINDAINYGFQSCTFSPGASPTLTIIAMAYSGTTYPYDFSTGNGVRVYLDNMVTLTAQTNKTIYGGITFVGSGSGTNQVVNKTVPTSNTDIVPISLTTAQSFPTGYPTVNKLWYSANDFQDVVFNLITGTPFNSTCRLTVVFPSYYNPGLSKGIPYCQVNGVYAQCQVGDISSTGVSTLSRGQRQLVIYGFSGSVASGSAITVRVNGITAPPTNYTAETFWIQINGANNEESSSIIYAGTATDVAYAPPPASVLPLNVVWHGVSSTITRSTATFTWSLYLNSATATLNTTTAVQAIFPVGWGLGWGEFAPTCQVVDFTNSSATYSAAISASTGNNSIFGNLVNMNITTAVPAGAVFNVTCSGVRTPSNDGYYRNQEVQLRVVDANGTFVWWRASPGQHNVNFTLAFAKLATQTYVSWSNAGTSSSPLSLTAGTYGLSVTATVPSKSSKSFTIAPTNSQFGFLLATTAPFMITLGYTQNSTVLGCAGSVPQGVYALTFTVSDNSSTPTYIAPPTMWVSVNTNAISISPSSSTLTSYYSSSSLSSTAPLYFDLSSYPPYVDITITPNAPSGNTNFTFTPASITLTPAAPKKYFVFTSTSAATAAASAAYTFTIGGTNIASYTMGSGTTVSLTTDTGTGAVSTPGITIAADSTDQSLAITKILSFTLSSVTQATVYWVVALQGQAITDASVIQANAAAMTAYDANSANQAQYATNYIVTSAKLTVSSLFPNTGYTVSAVAVSNTNKSSIVQSFTFVTGANAATIQRWIFNYTSAYPSQAQRQSLLCLLTQNLAVPALNVRTTHGEICGNTTAFYSTTNSTFDLGIYFYPLQANTDTTMTATALQTALNGTTSNVLSTMNTTLSSGTSGIGWYNAYVDLPMIRNAAPGITVPSSIPTAQLTSESIYFTFTASNDTGFIYVTLASNTTTTPTAVAMKQAAAGITTISGAVSTQVFYFYPGATVSYNFTNLTASTSYNVFVAASNNDPSFLQNFTSVAGIIVSTPATGSGSSGQMGVIFSVMAVFASIISLMMF